MFKKEAEEYASTGGLSKSTHFFGVKATSFKDGAKIGYNKSNEYAKTIIQDLLDNSDEYTRQRAMDFLEEKK